MVHSHDHSYDHGHDKHGHGHSHSHSHTPASFGKAFAIGITLNLAFVLIEGFYGYFANSLALWSDAGHNLSDVLGLLLAWFAIWLSKRTPSSQFTYGLRSSSILVAVANAILLIVAVGGIIFEAFRRFGAPATVEGSTVMIVAAFGILVNGITAWLFVAGSKNDLNIRGAFLHMAADAAVSAGVVIAGFVILKTGIAWIDPVVSIVIGLVILVSTWRLLKDSLALALAGVPSGIDVAEVKSFIESHADVASVHDLHVWGLSTSMNAFTAHIVVNEPLTSNSLISNLETQLAARFGLHHITIQTEIFEHHGPKCINVKVACESLTSPQGSRPS